MVMIKARIESRNRTSIWVKHIWRHVLIMIGTRTNFGTRTGTYIWGVYRTGTHFWGT
jgi:hypothetical protein